MKEKSSEIFIDSVTLNAYITVDVVPLDGLDILAAHLTIRDVVGLGVGHLEPVLVFNRLLLLSLLYGAVDLDFDSFCSRARLNYIKQLVKHPTQTKLKKLTKIIKSKLKIFVHDDKNVKIKEFLII